MTPDYETIRGAHLLEVARYHAAYERAERDYDSRAMERLGIVAAAHSAVCEFCRLAPKGALPKGKLNGRTLTQLQRAAKAWTDATPL